MAGAIPIGIDIKDDLLMDLKNIEKKITKKTKVIIPVHWGGASPDMFRILKLAKKYKIKIVEDACMGIGGKIKGK